MRLLTVFLLSAISVSAFAQSPVPSNLEPLPPPPAFEPGAASQDDLGEPQVTITKEAGQTVEEYSANGKLYMIKVTPAHGVPYYLVDSKGDGKFARQESADSGLRVPRWVIFKF